jgi:protein-S-isoprenylcysteine O-methyltransferase Ste14
MGNCKGLVYLEDNLIKYIPLLELPLLIIMILIRSIILHRHGIKAIVFGVTDQTDFILVPIVLFFFYALTASIFDLPFPNILIKPFWDIIVIDIIAIAICSISLIWFGITLKIFGNSFRVGIDKNTNNKLITNGTFSISRNPIYVGFISFFTGMFLIYSNILMFVFLLFLVIMIHRQILREEKFLREHYGNEYEEYCKKVRRYV